MAARIEPIVFSKSGMEHHKTSTGASVLCTSMKQCPSIITFFKSTKGKIEASIKEYINCEDKFETLRLKRTGESFRSWELCFCYFTPVNSELLPSDETHTLVRDSSKSFMSLPTIYDNGYKKLSHIEGSGPSRDDPKFEAWDDEDSLIMTWLWNSMTLEIS
ncbi:hypothetical protein CR513_18405, partial [Mucuna pruriens]